jgi:hypothetical protein
MGRVTRKALNFYPWTDYSPANYRTHKNRGSEGAVVPKMLPPDDGGREYRSSEVSDKIAREERSEGGGSSFFLNGRDLFLVPCVRDSRQGKSGFYADGAHARAFRVAHIKRNLSMNLTQLSAARCCTRPMTPLDIQRALFWPACIDSLIEDDNFRDPHFTLLQR